MNHRMTGNTRRAPARAIGINRTSGDAYTCPELTETEQRRGALAALQHPSRLGNRLYHRDGRVTTLDGQPVDA